MIDSILFDIDREEFLWMMMDIVLFYLFYNLVLVENVFDLIKFVYFMMIGVFLSEEKVE